MLSTLSNLMLHKQMIFEDGKLEVFGQPVVLNSLKTELGILKALEEKRLEKIIYYSAKEAGLEWFQVMNSKYGIKPKDIMRWGPDLINLGGWGKVIPLKVNLETSVLSFELSNSTIAKNYGKSDHPVDHYFRGLLTGAWQVACNLPIEGIETECSAMGAGACKFELKSRDQIDLTNPLFSQQI